MVIHALHEVEIRLRAEPEEVLGTVRLPKRFTGFEIAFGEQRFAVVEDRVGAMGNVVFVVPAVER
ncbi:hypothetical protein [Actinoplanes solisilvae]|uniref:hypothetical protein n=1 Tax=Actinoplanes solisilvae TaxID=2486853 RepID=UPI000FDA302A|nr:hypothetical protein [Actinoplanes solisilvae]